MHKHTHSHTHTRTRMHTHTHTHAHAHTHTYTHKGYQSFISEVDNGLVAIVIAALKPQKLEHIPELIE